MQHFSPFIQYFYIREQQSPQPSTPAESKGSCPTFVFIICDYSTAPILYIKCVGDVPRYMRFWDHSSLWKVHQPAVRWLLWSLWILLKELPQHQAFCSPADAEVCNRYSTFCVANPSSNSTSPNYFYSGILLSVTTCFISIVASRI